MDRDFFVQLCLATHRVGNLLNGKIQTSLKHAANAALSRFLLLLEPSFDSNQKKVFAKEVLEETQLLQEQLRLAKEQTGINPANFSLLEAEYARAFSFAQTFLSEHKDEISKATLPTTAKAGYEPVGAFIRENGAGKSLRAKKIVALVKAKGKAQVWELQKVLPQVTKRTLRRDLDVLVHSGILERKGEWNTVFYQMRPV